MTQVLRPLKEVFAGFHPADLLVGLDQPDDAVVWRVDGNKAIVATTDFFTPVVDDPYDYGAIAAANALSDVYAMGGEPFLALSLAAFPPDLPNEFLAEIIRGGADIAKAGRRHHCRRAYHPGQRTQIRLGSIWDGLIPIDILQKKVFYPATS